MRHDHAIDNLRATKEQSKTYLRRYIYDWKEQIEKKYHNSLPLLLLYVLTSYKPKVSQTLENRKGLSLLYILISTLRQCLRITYVAILSKMRPYRAFNSPLSYASHKNLFGILHSVLHHRSTTSSTHFRSR